MRIFLASFLQKENFGPGTVISICEGNKPKDIEVRQQFKYFIPTQDLVATYYDVLPTDKELASRVFVSGYKHQLDQVMESLKQAADREKIHPIDLLPFKDGDTLCSWEREERNNYRKILAPYLEKLGYEVILH